MGARTLAAARRENTNTAFESGASTGAVSRKGAPSGRQRAFDSADYPGHATASAAARSPRAGLASGTRIPARRGARSAVHRLRDQPRRGVTFKDTCRSATMPARSQHESARRRSSPVSASYNGRRPLTRPTVNDRRPDSATACGRRTTAGATWGARRRWPTTADPEATCRGLAIGTTGAVGAMWRRRRPTSYTVGRPSRARGNRTSRRRCDPARRSAPPDRGRGRRTPPTSRSRHHGSRRETAATARWDPIGRYRSPPKRSQAMRAPTPPLGILREPAPGAPADPARDALRTSLTVNGRQRGAAAAADGWTALVDLVGRGRPSRSVRINAVTSRRPGDQPRISHVAHEGRVSRSASRPVAGSGASRWPAPRGAQAADGLHEKLIDKYGVTAERRGVSEASTPGRRRDINDGFLRARRNGARAANGQRGGGTPPQGGATPAGPRARGCRGGPPHARRVLPRLRAADMSTDVIPVQLVAGLVSRDGLVGGLFDMTAPSTQKDIHEAIGGRRASPFAPSGVDAGRRVGHRGSTSTTASTSQLREARSSSPA